MSTDNILVKHLKHKNILLDGDQIFHVNAYGFLRPYSNFNFKLENDPNFNCGDANFIDLLNPKDESKKSKYKEIYDYIIENRNSIMGSTIQLNEQCNTEGSNIYYNKKNGVNDSNYSQVAYVNAKGEKSIYKNRDEFIKGEYSDKCPSQSIMVTEDQFNAPKNSGYYADKKPFCNLVPKRTPSHPTPNLYPDEAYPNKQRRRKNAKELPSYVPHYKLDRIFNRSSNVKPDFSLGTDGTRDDWNKMTSMGQGNKRKSYANDYGNVANMPYLKEATSELSRVNTGIYMRMILWFVLLCILLMIIVKIRNSNVSMPSFGSSTSNSISNGSASSGVVI